MIGQDSPLEGFRGCVVDLVVTARRVLPNRCLFLADPGLSNDDMSNIFCGGGRGQARHTIRSGVVVVVVVVAVVVVVVVVVVTVVVVVVVVVVVNHR